MDEWIAVLDELLVKPFHNDLYRPAADGWVHHVDLRVSQDFEDDETRADVIGPVWAAFEADRARLASAISARYGPPHSQDLRPYCAWETPVQPDVPLFSYLTAWFFEVRVWHVGYRGIVVEVGHADKEMPLCLMLVVGDLRGEPIAA